MVLLQQIAMPTPNRRECVHPLPPAAVTIPSATALAGHPRFTSHGTFAAAMVSPEAPLSGDARHPRLTKRVRGTAPWVMQITRQSRASVSDSWLRSWT